MHVEVQNASASGVLPSPQHLSLWASAAAADEGSELLIRVVDVAESAELNQQYRHKSGPTNVLSFPFEAPPGIACDLLGDLVVCAPVVEREAREQGKDLLAHWAHMIVHGTLHLQGYDHVEEEQARLMEEREIAILRELGFANPYEETP